MQRSYLKSGEKRIGIQGMRPPLLNGNVGFHPPRAVRNNIGSNCRACLENKVIGGENDGTGFVGASRRGRRAVTDPTN